MSDPTLDRAVAVLSDAPSLTLTLAELADAVGTLDVHGLAERLAADPRFRVIEPVGLPDLAGLPADRRAAYDRALRDAGLHAEARVALIGRAAPPADADTAALLVHTAARLLAPTAIGGDPTAAAIAAAADRAGRVLTMALDRDA